MFRRKTYRGPKRRAWPWPVAVLGSSLAVGLVVAGGPGNLLKDTSPNRVQVGGPGATPTVYDVTIVPAPTTTTTGVAATTTLAPVTTAAPTSAATTPAPATTQAPATEAPATTKATTTTVRRVVTTVRPPTTTAEPTVSIDIPVTVLPTKPIPLDTEPGH